MIEPLPSMLIHCQTYFEKFATDMSTWTQNVKIKSHCERCENSFVKSWMMWEWFFFIVFPFQLWPEEQRKMQEFLSCGALFCHRAPSLFTFSVRPVLVVLTSCESSATHSKTNKKPVARLMTKAAEVRTPDGRHITEWQVESLLAAARRD